MKGYKEKWRQLLAGYVVPDAERASSAGVPIPRLPKNTSAVGKLRWKQSVAPQCFNIDQPLTTQTLAIAAGAGSGNVAISDSSISGFATRFGSTFYEYCIVGARLEVLVGTTSTAQGVISVYVDEKSGTPSAAKARNSPHLNVPITSQNVGKPFVIEWKAQDYDDLLWNPIGTSFTAANVALFTDGTFGTAAGTTALVTITGTFALCFRGIRG